jgi:hypothetical protein
MLNGLPLPTLLRYGLTGVMALVVFVVLPFGLYSPSTALQFATPGAVAMLSAAGFVLGFVLDGLKLYQYSPGYEASKKDYYNKVRLLVGGSADEARCICSRAVGLEKELNCGDLFFQHSRWVMVTVFGTLFAAAGIGYIFVALCLAANEYWTLAARFLVSGAIFGLSCVRMFQTAKQIRFSVNIGYLHFVETHQSELGVSANPTITQQVNPPTANAPAD